jgi:hypothetical protein
MAMHSTEFKKKVSLQLCSMQLSEKFKPKILLLTTGFASLHGVATLRYASLSGIVTLRYASWH